MRTPRPPLVIAHRGASGQRPEHTLAAYALAIAQGADYIEPDLVATRDGVLVARHENAIGGTTDVATHPEFAARRTTKTIDGVPRADWFTEDFTLAELQTLRARERIPAIRPANAAYDGQFAIPTLDEIIALVRAEERTRGRRIGLYPETKHPSYFASIGLPLEEPLLAALAAHGYDGAAAPVFIQSFEVGNLRALARRTALPLIQLLNDTGRPHDFSLSGDARAYADLLTPPALADIATYACGVGAHKDLVLPRTVAGALGPPTTLVRDAHAAGLLVHVWTLRDEDVFLPSDLVGQPAAEHAAFLAAEVDGVFTDFPATGATARAAFSAPS